ncbi:HdaA/DnaA family protein [Aquabacter spiritensis]|uniref:DnaA protein n=1 Tax=Aquabacter spiritensis TaxID=933073 RepID=A0A4R3M6G6_9HYPH|nr:DnaA/Hda family protein [Aquabacter spiritensis]TCT08193.1 DnaA protein [Aquabacter spiritensis]
MPGREGSPAQLPLDLTASPALRREDFLVAPSNAAAAALIDRFPDWPAPVVCLTGPAGSGKSHLAAAFALKAGGRIVRAAALRAEEVPGALETGALAIEDLTAGAFDEAALFHVLNLAQEMRGHVLITARRAPSGFALATPDLASRLRAVPKVEIAPADDALLAAVLVKLFADRQIIVDEGVVHYLLARMERSVAGAEALVQAIDRASLAARRPVTRAFAAEVLRTAQQDVPDEEE